MTSNFVIDGEEAIIFSNERIYGILLTDGKFREISKKIKIGDARGIFYLTKGIDNYLLTTSQGIISVDKNGVQLYNVHITPPKAGILMHLVTFAASVALASFASVPVSIGGVTPSFGDPLTI